MTTIMKERLTGTTVHEKERRVPMSIRLRADLYRRLRKAEKSGPFRLTLISIIERGIELALDELEAQ